MPIQNPAHDGADTSQYQTLDEISGQETAIMTTKIITPNTCRRTPMPNFGEIRRLSSSSRPLAAPPDRTIP